MRKLLTISVAIFTAIGLLAQNQQAIVKTRGKLDDKGNVIPGRGLSGAFVKIIDGNTHESKAGGLLSFPVPGGKYSIEKVTYVDNTSQEQYQLLDMDELGRFFKYYPTPKDILVATPYEINEDRLDEEMRAREVLMANYRKRQAEIKQLQAANQISREEAQRLRQQLADAQANEEKLVSDMAERYAKMDFDRMSDFDREFAYFIRSGQLLRADSLLCTQGDVFAMEDTLRMIREENAAGRKIIADKEASLTRDKAMQTQNEEYEKQLLEKIADNFYKRYEIFSQQFQHDSAAFYLERRALLDTTRVEWQNEVGRYLDDNLADYGKALSYYQRCLHNAKKQYGEQSEWIATSLNNIGSVYNSQGAYSQALSHYEQALKIWRAVFGENHPDVATSLNNIGLVYHSQGAYSQALCHYEEALKILRAVFGENHPNVASCLNNIGSVYNSQGAYSQALCHYEQALKIRRAVFGENHPNVASCLNNIGLVYKSQGAYSQALCHYEQALKIRRAVFGENHPNVASCLNNIGLVYKSQGAYSQALCHYEEALKILRAVFGENHPKVATSLNNIGLVYKSQGAYSQALCHYEQALKIWRAVFGENHPYVATCLNNIGLVYYSLGEYLKVKAEYVFIATIVGDDTPAAKYGLAGEYVLLEYAGWNQDCSMNLFDKNAELKGKPKSLLLMKDGLIKRYHFENTIGARLGLKYVGKEERLQVNAAYRKWKKENEQ